MNKILVMTDLHLTAPPERIIGLDPGARFAAALAHAEHRHGDAERLIIMGDLTHRGEPAQYERLRNLVADAPWPVTFLMGNHDDRAAFAAAFPQQRFDDNGHLQSVIDMPGARLITLDTLDREATIPESGRLGPRRLAGLADALAGAGGRTCLVFLHHPPFRTGFRAMDAIGLQNGEEVRALLAQAGVAHVFAGHVHRAITASIDGVSFSTFKSPCHQMQMLLGQDGFGQPIDEPGAYAIVLAGPGSVVVHTVDFTLSGPPGGDG